MWGADGTIASCPSLLFFDSPLLMFSCYMYNCSKMDGKRSCKAASEQLNSL
jgi:hypothetical protein